MKRTTVRRLSGCFSGVLLLSLGAISGVAQAHKPSDSYLRLQVEDTDLSGRWDIALRDLHELIGLDADGDGAITWGEVAAQQARIEGAVLPRLTIRSGTESCALTSSQALRMVEHTDGPYAVLTLNGACSTPPVKLHIEYDLLFAQDRSHRGLLNLQFAGEHSDIFRPDRRSIAFSADTTGLVPLFLRYLYQGAWHIWAGFDHLLFLLCLLLPAVVYRSRSGWQVADSGRRAAIDLIRIITAFTVAHATSLTAASLDVLQLPTRWVEAAVAATIVFAAVNILFPMVHRRLWIVAFGFGLIHGAGYAGVLAGLGLSSAALTMALLGFNLGVEGGQILIAALVMPLMWLLRNQTWYRHGVIVPGAVLAAILGGLWLLQRLFNIRLEGFW